MLTDALLRRRVHQLHGVLGQPGEEFEAEGRLAFIAERLGWHLRRRRMPGDATANSGVADGLRGLIDARFRESMTLREASDALTPTRRTWSGITGSSGSARIST